jgi:predicted dienelactone hydrolase
MPIQKKHPLVLLSHGNGGMNLNHNEIAAAIVRSGFIAIALTHHGDNYQDRTLVGKKEYFTEQLRQLPTW